MNTLTTTLSLAAALLLSGQAVLAAEQTKTRAEVIAELQQAREAGEINAMAAEMEGVGALNNGLSANAKTQLAKKKAAEAKQAQAAAPKAAAATDGAASAK